MRLTAEITKSPDGRFEGRVTYGVPPTSTTFSGVLDLLRILEDVVPVTPPAPRPEPDADPNR
jgi:hypothetical protein